MCLRAHQHRAARLLRPAASGDGINADLHLRGGATGFTRHLHRSQVDVALLISGLWAAYNRVAVQENGDHSLNDEIGT